MNQIKFYNKLNSVQIEENCDQVIGNILSCVIDETVKTSRIIMLKNCGLHTSDIIKCKNFKLLLTNTKIKAITIGTDISDYPCNRYVFTYDPDTTCPNIILNL